ncbi:hypothetical protein AB3R30_14980 [Leptolyngbyaceae cyanobacterium UHCC 1019]
MRKVTGVFATITIVNLLVPAISLAQAIPKTLKSGMPYAQARTILINAGWRAVTLSPNRDRFGGMDHIINKLGYNEVETCSGTGIGFCRFTFANANGQKLAVVTINNQPGQQPKLQRWWINTENR